MKPFHVKRLANTSFKLTAVASLSLLFSNAAFAFTDWFVAERHMMCSYTLDCSHWYVGGNIGVSRLHDDPTPGLGSSVNQYGPGWSALVGYQLNSMLGVELGYTQYHDSRETLGILNIAKTEHYAVDLATVVRYPLFYRFSAIGKLGVAYSYANKIFNLGPAAASGAVSLYGGAGLGYSITPRVDMILEWAGVRGNNHTGSSELYSLGFTFAIV